MPWHVGIDENGLGPQLGPLIVTAVLAELSDDAGKRIEEEGSFFLHERLADSKQLVGHHHIGLGEAWARALGAFGALGALGAPDPRSLVQHLSLDSIRRLQAPCPRRSKPMCWFDDGEVFEAGQELVDQAKADLEHLRHLGINVKWTRSSVNCVRRINQARREGISRSDLDLRSMEALILGARAFADTEIVARCGKVGGLMRYTGKFTRLSNHLVTVLDEQGAESSYSLAGLGRVQFLRDAEERDPLVSLASLVGKWMREVLMRRIVRFFQQDAPSLPDASGYNDPVSDRFVRDSAKVRQEHGIDDECFVRARQSKK